MTRVTFAALLIVLGAMTQVRAADLPPDRPGNPLAVAYGASSGAISWQRATDDRLVVGYEVSRDGVVLGTFDALGYVDRSLEPGREHRFTIVSIDTIGQRSGKARVTLTTPDAPPSSPTGVRADVYSRRTAELFWDRSGVFGERYRIKRDGQVVATTDGTSYIDRSLSDRRAYLFEVIALNRQNQRSPSTRLFVGTANDGDTSGPPTRVPVAGPIGLRSIVYSRTAAELFWERADVPGQRYEVSRDGVVLGITDGTGYVDDTLLEGRTYTYGVVQITPAGDRSAAQSIMLGTPGGSTAPPAPSLAAPADLRVRVYSRTALELFWDRSDLFGLRYEVVRDGVVVGTTDGTSYLDDTLSSATSYAYQVVAVDRAGNRSPAARIATTTQPGPEFPPQLPDVTTLDGAVDQLMFAFDVLAGNGYSDVVNGFGDEIAATGLDLPGYLTESVVDRTVVCDNGGTVVFSSNVPANTRFETFAFDNCQAGADVLDGSLSSSFASSRGDLITTDGENFSINGQFDGIAFNGRASTSADDIGSRTSSLRGNLLYPVEGGKLDLRDVEIDRACGTGEVPVDLDDGSEASTTLGYLASVSGNFSASAPGTGGQLQVVTIERLAHGVDGDADGGGSDYTFTTGRLTILFGEVSFLVFDADNGDDATYELTLVNTGTRDTVTMPIEPLMQRFRMASNCGG